MGNIDVVLGCAFSLNARHRRGDEHALGDKTDLCMCMCTHIYCVAIFLCPGSTPKMLLGRIELASSLSKVPYSVVVIALDASAMPTTL